MPISLRGTSATLLMVAFCVSLLSPCDSEATLSRLPDGLDLVLDPETGSRNLPTLVLGETFQVHAMVRELTGYGVGAFRSGSKSILA